MRSRTSCTTRRVRTQSRGCELISSRGPDAGEDLNLRPPGYASLRSESAGVRRAWLRHARSAEVSSGGQKLSQKVARLRGEHGVACARVLTGGARVRFGIRGGLRHGLTLHFYGQTQKRWPWASRGPDRVVDCPEVAVLAERDTGRPVEAVGGRGHRRDNTAWRDAHDRALRDNGGPDVAVDVERDPVDSQ